MLHFPNENLPRQAAQRHNFFTGYLLWLLQPVDKLLDELGVYLDSAFATRSLENGGDYRFVVDQRLLKTLTALGEHSKEFGIVLTLPLGARSLVHARLSSVTTVGI